MSGSPTTGLSNTLRFNCIGISTDPSFMQGFGHKERHTVIQVQKKEKGTNLTIQDIADAAHEHFSLPKTKKVHCWFYDHNYFATGEQSTRNRPAVYHKPEEPLSFGGHNVSVAGATEHTHDLLFCNVVDLAMPDPFSVKSSKLIHASQLMDGGIHFVRVFESTAEFTVHFNLVGTPSDIFSEKVSKDGVVTGIARVTSLFDVNAGQHLIVGPKGSWLKTGPTGVTMVSWGDGPPDVVMLSKRQKERFQAQADEEERKAARALSEAMSKRDAAEDAKYANEIFRDTSHLCKDELRDPMTVAISFMPSPRHFTACCHFTASCYTQAVFLEGALSGPYVAHPEGSCGSSGTTQSTTPPVPVSLCKKVNTRPTWAHGAQGLAFHWNNVSSLQAIGPMTLYWCQGLSEVHLCNLPRLTSIGNGFLNSASGLTTVSLKELPELASVGDAWMKDCAGLTAVQLAGLLKLHTIGSWWMARCHQLTSLEVSKVPCLTSVGGSMLEGLEQERLAALAAQVTGGAEMRMEEENQVTVGGLNQSSAATSFYHGETKNGLLLCPFGLFILGRYTPPEPKSRHQAEIEAYQAMMAEEY